MKKLLGILVLTFLFSGNANAGVNEPGTAFLGKCKGALKWEHKKLKKIYLEKDKKINVIIYASCNAGTYGFGHRKGKNLEALHKKAYKICLKYAKKHTPGEDCYLYAVNEEMVWKYDKAKQSAKAKAELAEAKTELEKQAQIDKKPGRFIEDQPDVNDDHQIHFIYLLSSEGKDTELDISGWIEKRVNSVNDKFLKMSARNKKSNGIGQQFKLDMTKEGKLDVTFVRMNVSKNQLDVPDYPTDMIYLYLRQKGFNNPKKVYATFVGFKSKHGNSDGGEGNVPMMIIYAPAVKTYGQPDMDLVILHELFHTQAAAYGCGKRTYKGSHVKGSDILAVGELSTSIDSNNNTYYRHDIEGCPDLAKSVFVTPTAEDSWDPYDVFCRKKKGNFTHPDLYREFRECKAGAK
jgi:hypothetical protein